MKTTRHTPLLLLLGASLLHALLPTSAQAQFKVTHLDKTFNTTGSETGALRVGDTVMVFASMPPVSQKGGDFRFNSSIMQLYQARIARSGKVGRPKPNRWGLNSKKAHTGNLAVDPVSHDLYFTRGDVETLRCDIWWARKKKRGWDKPQRLKGPVNSKLHTSTHPTVSRLADGTVLLYFVSDRPGGLGGMDLWYTLVRDGVAEEPVNLGPQLNSAYDEYTPFYDQPNGVLYFSSDRPGGKGGFDIYCAVGSRNTWQPAEPVCGCLNSEQNDLYYTITDHDSLGGMPIAGYLCSNRPDSFFLNDSMCCNDIYRWSIDSGLWQARQLASDDTASPAATHQPPTPHYSFPLALYFHNDDPDPWSQEPTTAANYADCQLRYALMRSSYMAHQPTAADSARMQRFFDSCVVGNFDRLNALLDHVEEQLYEGRRVVLTVTGHASPVYTDAYNHTLSQRRIASFINLLRTWRKGLFADALDSGSLRVVQQPQGAEKQAAEGTAGLKGDPVYGLPAARSRRIEILACEEF